MKTIYTLIIFVLVGGIALAQNKTINEPLQETRVDKNITVEPEQPIEIGRTEQEITYWNITTGTMTEIVKIHSLD